MKNPFKKKPAPIKYADLPTPEEKLKRLEKALTEVIKYNKEAHWAVAFLVDIQEVRLMLEARSAFLSRSRCPGGIQILD